MNTSPILNPVNISQNLTSTGKQLDGASQDVPFKQVLSREIAERNSQRDTENANTAQPVNPAPQTQTGTTDAGTTKETSDKPKDTIDAAPDSASAEMLALAANAIPIDLRVPAVPLDALTLAAPAIRSVGVEKVDLSTIAGATDLFSKLPATGLADAKNLQDKSLAANLAGVAESDGKAALTGMQMLQAKVPPAGMPDLASKSQPSALDALQTKVQASGLQQGADQTETLAAKDAKLKPVADFATALNRGGELKPQADISTATKTQEVLPGLSVQQGLELNAAKTPEAPSAAMLGALQQATMGNVQTLTSQASDKLSPPVGSPGWDQALGQKVSWMVAGGQQSASLTLNPPDLGPLQVVLSVTNSHASATFTAAQPEVRQALEAAMPKLREMMADNGIQLDQSTVSTGMPNQNQFSAPGEQTQQVSHYLPQAGKAADALPLAVRPLASTAGLGTIDTFA